MNGWRVLEEIPKETGMGSMKKALTEYIPCAATHFIYIKINKEMFISFLILILLSSPHSFFLSLKVKFCHQRALIVTLTNSFELTKS